MVPARRINRGPISKDSGHPIWIFKSALLKRVHQFSLNYRLFVKRLGIITFSKIRMQMKQYNFFIFIKLNFYDINYDQMNTNVKLK